MRLKRVDITNSGLFIVYIHLYCFLELGSIVTNQNCIQDEIKWRLQAGNWCYYSVQILLSSRLKNLKIKIYKTIILSIVLNGNEAWSLTLREELRVFENRSLRRKFGPKREENGECRRLHNEELHNFYCLLNIVRVIKSRRLR